MSNYEPVTIPGETALYAAEILKNIRQIAMSGVIRATDVEQAEEQAEIIFAAIHSGPQNEERAGG